MIFPHQISQEILPIPFAKKMVVFLCGLVHCFLLNFVELDAFVVNPEWPQNYIIFEAVALIHLYLFHSAFCVQLGLPMDFQIRA